MARTARLTGHDGTATSWPGNVGVTSGEFAYFDQACFKSISETGGAYSLDSDLTIGGAYTIEFAAATLVSGTLTVTGILSVTGNATIGDSAGDSLTVNSSQTYNGGESHNGVEAHGGIEVHTGAETHTGTVDFTGNVAIDGGTSGVHKTFTGGAYVDSTWHGSVTFAGSTTYTGNESHSGSEIHGGTITNGGVTSQVGSLIEIWSQCTTSQTVSADVRYVEANIVSGGFIQLTAGAGIGKVVSIVNTIASTTVVIKSPSGGTICSLVNGAGPTGTDFKWVDVIWNGTIFYPLRGSYS